MAKKELLSKLKIKNYNNELEIILEKKDFSIQVKNLLLSMFYKLETNYKDYSIVKHDVLSKEEFLEGIINIIQTKCNKIELVKPKDNDAKKFWVYEIEGKIECYQNEAVLLHAILEIGKKEYGILKEYDILKKAVQKVLANGYELDIKEMLTNFDGWAWNNNIDKFDDIESFLIYQNLRILMGNSFLYEWKRDRRKKDYFSNIKNVSIEYWKVFCKLCVMKSIQNKEEKCYIEKELKNIKQLLNKMKEKDSFLKETYEEKRKVSERIKLLDKILNDTGLMKEEFLSRNSNVPEEEKIFSISDLEELIQKERNEYMGKLQDINNSLEPQKYIENIKKLEEKIELIESVKINNVTLKNIENELTNMQIAFIQTLKQKVANVVTKKEIIELVYAFRYYLYLPIKIGGKTSLIKDFDKIEKELEELFKKIITKACKLGALIIINQDINYNFKIMKRILDTKIMNLDDIYIVFTKTEEEINIEIYDSEILDRTEVVTKENEKDFMIKFNKKIKIFV